MTKMKSLDEIRIEKSKERELHISQTDFGKATAYVAGFEDGVKAAQERAQVLVDAIEEYTINNYSFNLDDAVETYKKSTELK